MAQPTTRRGRAVRETRPAPGSIPDAECLGAVKIGLSGAPAAEEQGGKQRDADSAHDARHWVGLHRATGPQGLNGGGLCQDSPFVATTVGDLASDFSGA